MADNKCSTCSQTFNSERELQEHQRDEHSGSQENSFPEPSTGDQAERREKIA